MSAGELDQLYDERGESNTHRQAEADLFGDQAQREISGTPVESHILGEGQEDEQDRHADTVVQAALHVQPLSDISWDASTRPGS